MARPQTAQGWFERGERYRRWNRPKQALKYYLSARRLKTTTDLEQQILHASALCYGMMGNYGAANVWFSRAVPSVRFGKDVPDGPKFRDLTSDEQLRLHQITRDWAYLLARWQRPKAFWWSPQPMELLEAGEKYFRSVGDREEHIKNGEVRYAIEQLERQRQSA